MEPDDFNAAAHAFAATAVPGEWTVTEMTDALGTAHTLLTTTWLAPAKPLVPSSSSARSRGPAERRDEVEDGGDEWDVSSDDDARAPLPRPPVAGSGTAAHECRVRLCVSWSPTFRVPTACFTAEDAVTARYVVSAEELQRYFPWLNVDGEGVGALVTPTVHELLCRVMYLIHPCDVHTLMSEMLPAQSSSVRDSKLVQLHAAQIRFVVGFAASTLRAAAPEL
jgi:hypothetical protein